MLLKIQLDIIQKNWKNLNIYDCLFLFCIYFWGIIKSYTFQNNNCFYLHISYHRVFKITMGFPWVQILHRSSREQYFNSRQNALILLSHLKQKCQSMINPIISTGTMRVSNSFILWLKISHILILYYKQSREKKMAHWNWADHNFLLEGWGSFFVCLFGWLVVFVFSYLIIYSFYFR